MSWTFYYTHKIIYDKTLSEYINSNKNTKSLDKVVNKKSHKYLYNYHNELFNILWL